MRRSRKPYEIRAAWAALALLVSLPSSHHVRGQNCTNSTSDIHLIAGRGNSATAAHATPPAAPWDSYCRRRSCTHVGGARLRAVYDSTSSSATCRPICMVCLGERSPESSFSRRTNWPMLGGRDTRPRPASQRSSLARVGLRGAAPRRKSRSPFGLIASSCATRRNEERAVSRAITSRSKGTGSAGRLTRVATGPALRLGVGAPARLNRHLTYEGSPPSWKTAQTEHCRYIPPPPGGKAPRKPSPQATSPADLLRAERH